MKKKFFQSGVTLIELMIVLSIISILLTLTTVNVTQLIPKANVNATIDTLITDLKAQQQKSMLGETEGGSTAQQYGVHIDPGQYVLFAGASYSASVASNSAFPVISSVQLSTTFPNGNILFSRGSGEIPDYATASSTVTILDTATQQTKTIYLNQYGVITSVQ